MYKCIFSLIILAMKKYKHSNFFFFFFIKECKVSLRHSDCDVFLSQNFCKIMITIHGQFFVLSLELHLCVYNILFSSANIFVNFFFLLVCGLMPKVANHKNKFNTLYKDGYCTDRTKVRTFFEEKRTKCCSFLFLTKQLGS